VRRSRRPYSRAQLNIERVLTVLYAGGWAARLWALVPGATRVGLFEHTLETGLRAGRPPLKVAFASDLHIGPTTPRQTLDNAFALLKDARPDVLLLGGDYVFLGATQERVRELNDRVAEVPAAVKIAVLGNHDFWARPARLEVALAAAGTIVLVNEAMRLPPPHDDVAVIGLDDPFTARTVQDRETARRAAEKAVEGAAGASVKIALCHAPDGAPLVRGRGLSLFLCGHTHGGHIALPGGRPLWMPSPMGQLWPWGLHQVDGMALFVSRGVGGSLVPIRTYAPPDVAVFTVR
jgi:predicted MPP superfamily phosphohydrolase